MNILLIGSGGREHAIARSLCLSPSSPRVYATPGNPGIAQYAECISLPISEHRAVIEWCKEFEIDLIVVGPEQPLDDGLTDSLRIEGFSVFGPSKAASRLETSKGYAKDFMKRYGIPTADYRRFTAEEVAEAKLYCTSLPLPVVIKADGLAAGKGVVIATTYDEAYTTLDEMFSGLFGSASTSIVIEEFMHGEEASIFALCDGSKYVTLAPAQDHKRIGDNDTGKNTGGMGSYAPAPIVSDEVLSLVKSTIIEPTISGMQRENAPFVGCMFIGLMIHNGQPRVVEYNVRFGDPETQSVLSILKADTAKLFKSISDGELDTTTIESIQNGTACTVVLASGGYPDGFEKGFEITGIEEATNTSLVFHAGTALNNGSLISNGGRVLGVTSVANNLSNAITQAYSAVDAIHFDKMYFRKDIGAKGLKHS